MTRLSFATKYALNVKFSIDKDPNEFLLFFFFLEYIFLYIGFHEGSEEKETMFPKSFQFMQLIDFMDIMFFQGYQSFPSTSLHSYFWVDLYFFYNTIQWFCFIYQKFNYSQLIWNNVFEILIFLKLEMEILLLDQSGFFLSLYCFSLQIFNQESI